MERFVPLDKRSKREQKEFYKTQRKTWNDINPMTRVIQSAKAYNRTMQKARDRKRQSEEE